PPCVYARAPPDPDLHSFPTRRSSDLIRFDEMLATFERLPERSIVLLQPCCHNPTGIDPSREQWLKVIDVLVRRQAIPFFDMAYQDRKSTRLNSSHVKTSYAVFCLKKK